VDLPEDAVSGAYLKPLTILLGQIESSAGGTQSLA
jgi:hypothetical protein